MSTILIATDETHLSSRLIATLKDAGLTAVCVANGVEAYRTARSLRPDLVIADYRLARLGGLELCAKLNHDRLTSEIPVVLMTAHGFGSPQSGCPSNVQRVLTKPVSPHAMLTLVRALLRTRLVGAGTA